MAFLMTRSMSNCSRLSRPRGRTGEGGWEHGMTREKAIQCSVAVEQVRVSLVIKKRFSRRWVSLSFGRHRFSILIATSA